MEIKAVQRYTLTSPRKLREVSALIRDLTPTTAVERLPFVAKRAGEPIRRVIQTAVANAKQKGLNPQDLVFKEIQINEGPRLRRFRAGARGRIKPYKRRMSHIRVILATKSEVNKQSLPFRSKKLATTDSTDSNRITPIETIQSAIKSAKPVVSRKGGKTRVESVKSVNKSA